MSQPRLSKKELEAFVRKSYELVKSKLPKKLQEKLNRASAFKSSL